MHFRIPASMPRQSGPDMDIVACLPPSDMPCLARLWSDSSGTSSAVTTDQCQRTFRPLLFVVDGQSPKGGWTPTCVLRYQTKFMEQGVAKAAKQASPRH